VALERRVIGNDYRKAKGLESSYEHICKGAFEAAAKKRESRCPILALMSKDTIDLLSKYRDSLKVKSSRYRPDGSLLLRLPRTVGVSGAQFTLDTSLTN